MILHTHLYIFILKYIIYTFIWVGGKGGVLAQTTPQKQPKTPKIAKTPKGPPLPENALSAENAILEKVGRQTPKTPLQTQSWAPTSKCLNDLPKRQWDPTLSDFLTLWDTV